MKKVFIGLLIVAAGAGIYYLLQNKKTKIADPIEKELLVGTWKIDSFYVSSKDSVPDVIAGSLLKDSSFRRHRYDFQNGGTFLQTVNDSAKVKTDTSYYEWGKKNELLIKEAVKDSVGEQYTISKLSKDSLILQSKDSAVFVFTKLK